MGMCIGGGHISTVLAQKGLLERKSDLIDRTGDTEIFDFLNGESYEWDGDIITNPPYRFAQEFVEKSLSLIKNEHKVAMFLKIQFLEGKARRRLFDYFPPKKVYVASGRLNCAKNGDFDKYESSAVCYAWFVWEKGFSGKPQIEWIN